MRKKKVGHRKTTLTNKTNPHQTHHQNKRSHPVATPAEGGKSPRPAWYINPQPTGTHQPISKHNTPAHTPPTHSHVLCDAGTVAREHRLTCVSATRVASLVKEIQTAGDRASTKRPSWWAQINDSV